MFMLSKMNEKVRKTKDLIEKIKGLEPSWLKLTQGEI